MRYHARSILLALFIVGCSESIAAQSVTPLDSARTELIRLRGFVRAAETQATKTLLVLERATGRVDTVTIVVVDTVYLTAPQPDPVGLTVDTTPRSLEQGTILTAAHNPPNSLAVFDWPTRVYENNVYLGSQRLGMVRAGHSEAEWWAYQLDPDPLAARLVRLPNSYPTKEAAMRALLTP